MNINTEIPSYLYHGTTSAAVDGILDDGLQPRDVTGASNWDERNVPSIPGHVYLTRLYAPHFADAAQTNGEPIAIVEIDIDVLNQDTDLYPDEDFIEQSLRGGTVAFGFDEIVDVPDGVDIDLTGDMEERTSTIRENIDVFQSYWELSLLGSGNVSHRGAIPVEAISRVSVVDMPGAFRISILNEPSIPDTVIHAAKNELLTQWMMGENVTADDIVNATPHGENAPEAMRNAYHDLLDPSIIDVRENPAYDGRDP